MDYIANVTLALPFTAKNQEQANDRMEAITNFIESALQGTTKGKPTWLNLASGVDMSNVEAEAS